MNHFVVIAGVRTGSSMLISCLQQHPNLRCKSELFNVREKHGQPAIDRAERAVAELFANEISSGFKLLYNQGKESTIWQTLSQMDDLSVIHLQRRRWIESLVSMRTAAVTGRWSWLPKSTAPEEPLVWVDPEWAVRFFEEREAGVHRVETLLGHHRLLNVAYERLAADTFGTIADVYRFLGVEPVIPTIYHRKMARRHWHERVANWPEVREALLASRFASHIEMKLL